MAQMHSQHGVDASEVELVAAKERLSSAKLPVYEKYNDMLVRHWLGERISDKHWTVRHRRPSACCWMQSDVYFLPHACRLCPYNRLLDQANPDRTDTASTDCRMCV
jgi:hypothetical protein